MHVFITISFHMYMYDICYILDHFFCMFFIVIFENNTPDALVFEIVMRL